MTGPSGWIGQAMLAVLVARGVRDLRLFGSREGTVLVPGTTQELSVRPLDTIAPADVAGAHCVHLAYLTKEKNELLGEVEFRRVNTAIDAKVLHALREGTPASLFVASSGAASLAESGRDLHPYGLTKLEQEERFLDFADSSGVPVLAGRIFNLAGPYINKIESYAISNFARQARIFGRIAIEARMPVFRSYLHILDLCSLVLAAATSGLGRKRPVDLCGAEVVEMEDLAWQVATACGGVPVTRENLSFGSSGVYLGNFTETKMLAMELGCSLSGLADQIRDTIGWLGLGGGADACASEAGYNGPNGTPHGC